jgi:hypothetical protein
MTEDQIERSVELKTNAADNALMSGRMTQAEYDAHMREITRWADNMVERTAPADSWAINEKFLEPED